MHLFICSLYSLLFSVSSVFCDLLCWISCIITIIYLLLGGIAEGKSHCCGRCYRSMVCLSVRLSHCFILLKPLDRMKCYLAAMSRVVPTNTGPVPSQEGEIGGRNPQSKFARQIAAKLLQITVESL